MTDAAPVSLRRATEADQPWIRDRVDDWFGRRTKHLVRRQWFRHFGETSWIAHTADDRIRGFLLGYPSPSLPGTAVLHLLAVDPNVQRRGIGRLLVGAFADDARAAGRTRIEVEHWPDEPMALAFLRAVGFRVVEDLPGSMRLYGVPALPEHEGPNEDRVRLELDLG